MIDKNALDKLSKKLKEKKLRLATAESATGGLIAHILTNISGSSDYFDRGIISYSNKAKIELLDVSREDLAKYGAVSEIIARQMADGARKKSGVDIAVSTTGIAGPTGGSKEKPVGTVFICFSSKTKTLVKRFKFIGDRLEIKEQFCKAALEMILENIS